MSYRRRGRRANVGHSGDWLLTYADTITLLLCLFVLLVAHKPGVKADVMPAATVEQHGVANNFVDWKPSQAISTETPSDDAHAGLSSAEDPLPATPARSDIPAAERAIAAQPLYRIGAPARAEEIPQPVPPPTAADSAPQQISVARAAPLSEIVVDVPPDPAVPPDQKGDRITTLAFDSAAFFSRGAATLNSSGIGILQEVVVNLKSEEYRDYMVTIEGHTDDAPISTAQFPSNWELSTARAAAVVRFLVEQGMPAQRLRAAGYADTHPLQPNRDDNGIAIPENQAKNRRVVIRLEKIEHH